VEQISFKQGSTVRMTTTKQYDFLNRLTGIASLPAGASAVGFAYEYNPANQRTVRQEADGSYWRYEYDALGQVRSGKKYWADGTPVAGQQFAYAFDDIGNRVGTGAGGDENGLNLRWALYAANELNQYWSNTVPAAVDVLGVSLATSAVQVNGLAAYRKGEYFRKELPVDNSGGPVWTNVTVTAAGQSAVSGHAAVAPALQGFSYDLDGNLTQDGLWVYTWDGENRLVAVESVWGVAEAGRRRVDFGYDAQGRRVEQVVSGWDGQGWGYVPQSTNRFVYNGWNLVAVLDGNNAPLLSFTWGTDLSGSVQGAGGVGGLSSLTVHTGPNAGRYFYAYDGNGNVMALVSAADGSVAARYEYGPFGELIRATGPMAKTNPFRFSTKYQDEETGLVYYGYRYYDPSTGRWPNRDPIGEPGFELLRRKQASASTGEPNRYLFVKNNPLQNIDPEGLDLITITYTNGTTVTYGTFSSPNLGQLMGALTNAAGTIAGITIKGHACCTMQSFGDDFITMDSTGTQILATDGTNILPALQGALAPGAWIYLAGCGTGRGGGNIAQQMSAVLPGVTVSGHQGRFALNVPFCGCALGKRNYYINGDLQHSAW